MNIKTLKELDAIQPSQLRELKEKGLDNYCEKSQLSLNQINTTYHVFQFEGEDSFVDTEEEALKELDRFSRTLEGDEAQIVLNIARRGTGETKDDEEVSLIKFERTQEDKDLIQKIKQTVQSYHDTENYITRVYDEKDTEIHAFYTFNRTEKETEKESTQDVKDAYDYTITKIEINEWVRDEHKISESHAHELVDLIINI